MITLTYGDLLDRCVNFYGDETVITFKDRSYTYDQLGYESACLAHALQQLGLKKGDRVALLMPNCPEVVVLDYAMSKIGLVAVSLAIFLNPNDHIYMMNQSECAALVYHEMLAPRVKDMIPHLETLKHFICVGEDTSSIIERRLHFGTLIEESPPEPSKVEIDPEDLLGIGYTGGTTGKPKGVMLSNRAWVYTLMMEMLELGFAWEEVFLYATPLTHAGRALLLPVMMNKGRCVIIDRFDPGLLLSTIEKEKVTATFLVPTMIYMLLDHPDLDEYDLYSLKNIIYGASAIAPERLKQALDIFGPIFTQLYGQSEAPMMISVLRREEHMVKERERERIWSSAGRPTRFTELRILDDEGEEVERGEKGEIAVRCPNMMSGYLKNPEGSAKAIRDGWLHTGDIAREDEEGFIYIVDRKKDMIVSGGFNVYPREVEDVLFEHPAVKVAAVIGVPHEKWGEEVRAIVILKDGESVTEEELIAFVKERKGSMLAPKAVEFWEEIPLTIIGKVDKKAIREKFWGDRERRV